MDGLGYGVGRVLSDCMAWHGVGMRRDIIVLEKSG
jgi:hypothetical protein